MTTRPNGAGEHAHQATRQPQVQADQAQDAVSAAEPPAVTWARARIREQIRHAGAALTATSKTADKHTPEPDRSPLADREPEP